MYHANVCVKERMAPEAINWQYHAATLRVDPGKVTRGQFYQANTWSLTHSAQQAEQRSALPAATRDSSLRTTLASSP
jgi:hypothetical protein